jgi:hypothetical protein
MAKPIRKNVLLDPEGFRRVQEILGTQSAAETIREALNLVVFRQEIIRGFDQVVKPRFRTTHVSLSNFWVPIQSLCQGGDYATLVPP